MNDLIKREQSDACIDSAERERLRVGEQSSGMNLGAKFKEINCKDLKFNPFNLIGGEWMLITAGDEYSSNTMTASWGHLGCLWGHDDPSAVITHCTSAKSRRYWCVMMNI